MVVFAKVEVENLDVVADSFQQISYCA